VTSPQSYTNISILLFRTKYNGIFPFTVTFGGLTSLTELSLAENRLLELPPSFGALKSLRKLSAESNWYTPQRVWLASEEERRTKNEKRTKNERSAHPASLRCVSLRALPAEFRHLSKLQMASFKSNQFREIPTSFLFLKYAARLRPNDFVLAHTTAPCVCRLCRRPDCCGSTWATIRSRTRSRTSASGSTVASPSFARHRRS
jgi:hypothetical protein